VGEFILFHEVWIESEVSPSEAMRRISSLIDPETESRDEVLGILLKIGHYSGRTGRTRFLLRRKLREYRDAGHAPSLAGEVTMRNDGCEVHVRFRSWGWLVPAALVAVVGPAVALFVQTPVRSVAGVLCFAAIYHGAGCLIFRFERTRAERDLRGLLVPHHSTMISGQVTKDETI
jgi:hypothetical protein